MKKILFATTALIATAGLASAEIALSGYAEIGVADFGRMDNGDDGAGVQFYNEFDLKFLFSGESDTGLSFGATIDLDEIPSQYKDGNQKSSVWVSGTYGTITMGDTDGAYDWAMIEVGRGTSLADDHTTHAGYNGNSEEGTRVIPGYNGINVRYDYSFGDFGVAISAQMDDTCEVDDVTGIQLPGCELNNPIVSLGGRWNTELANGDLGIGLGYSTNSNVDIWGISGKFDIANVLTNATYSSLKSDQALGDVDQWGVGLGYQWDALLLQVNYGKYEFKDWDASQDGWGFVANYDLGGGAIAAFGYGASSAALSLEEDLLGNVDAVFSESRNFWSAGMILNF